MNTASTVKNGAAATAPASRMSLSNVVKGPQRKPCRALVFGPPGVGKTTFAANAPSPILICGEDGAAQLDVARFAPPKSWADVLEAVRILANEEHSYRTLVIDSLDWIEPLLQEQVCAAGGKRSIADFSFGAGYAAALELWRDFIRRLEMLERAKKMNIIMIAHAAVEKHNDPFAGEFDRYRLKLHKRAADLLSEWTDLLLFARHEVRTVTDRNKKTRAQSDGARLLHTQWTHAWDAKTRYAIPEQLPLSWDELDAAIRASSPVAPEKLRAELETLIEQLAPAEQEQAKQVVRDWVGNNNGRLAQMVDRVRGKVLLAETPEVEPAS